MAAVSELRRLRNGASALPVAFLDEDVTKHHRTLAGVPIVGSVADLPEVVRRMEADAVVIAVGHGARPEEAARIAERAVALCEANEIPHHRWVGLVTE
jgi:FlaA1/EpsC-like NDP-sugar epimerase